MDTKPRNTGQTDEQVVEALYDGNAAQPLPIRPGEFYASFAAPQAQHRSAAVFEQTGEHLDVDRYRVLDELPAGLVVSLVTGDINNTLADARVPDDAEAEAIALDQRIAADTAESRRRIVAQYGPKNGPQLIERTQRWVRTQPALAQMLQRGGLGSKPDIVEALVAHVFSNGIR
jgi:hypothetical protein